MAKKIRTLEDFKLDNKVVIVRSNLDVSIENGEVTDSLVIKSVAQTIKHLISRKCKVVILSR